VTAQFTEQLMMRKALTNGRYLTDSWMRKVGLRVLRIMMLGLNRLRGRTLVLLTYVASSSILTLLFVISQYCRHGIFGTRLLLGYDSSFYAWSAREVITRGPIYMMQHWGYPHLYVQLLAFLGYLSGDIIMIERILPLFFCILLVYANCRLVLGITDNIHIAGFATFLTATSLNTLRILSDLNRQLMTLSLSFIVLLNAVFIGTKNFSVKKCAFFALLLLIIANTQIETFLVLSVSLMLYGILSRSLKKIVIFAMTCIISFAPCVLLRPNFLGNFFTDLTSPTVSSFDMELIRRALTIEDILLWAGGSWLLFSLLLIGTAYLFYKTVRQRNESAAAIFSWILVVDLLLILVNFIVLPAKLFRILLILPVPVLVAFGIQLLLRIQVIKRVRVVLQIRRSSLKRFFSFSLYLPISILLALLAVLSSISTSFNNYNIFFSPRISNSGHQKIITTRNYLVKNNLSVPIFVFYGSSAGVTDIYRGYIGAELGEHFAYYGKIENLLNLTPTEFESSLEKGLSSRYYMELVGNAEGVGPHAQYIKDKGTLFSRPIIIIIPELYSAEIPHYTKPFHIGQGIHVIPPKTLT